MRTAALHNYTTVEFSGIHRILLNVLLLNMCFMSEQCNFLSIGNKLNSSITENKAMPRTVKDGQLFEHHRLWWYTCIQSMLTSGSVTCAECDFSQPVALLLLLLQLLIGFECGVVVLWDLKSKKADYRYNYDEVRHYFLYTQFLWGHQQVCSRFSHCCLWNRFSLV